jgi:hypothetical protein
VEYRCDLFHKEEEEGETPSIWDPLSERDAKRSAKKMRQKVRTSREKQRMEEKKQKGLEQSYLKSRKAS